MGLKKLIKRIEELPIEQLTKELKEAGVRFVSEKNMPDYREYRIALKRFKDKGAKYYTLEEVEKANKVGEG